MESGAVIDLTQSAFPGGVRPEAGRSRSEQESSNALNRIVSWLSGPVAWRDGRGNGVPTDGDAPDRQPRGFRGGTWR